MEFSLLGVLGCPSLLIGAGVDDIDGKAVVVTSPRPPSLMVGDSPTYIDPVRCSEPARRLISQRKIPLDHVHSCKWSPQKIKGELYQAVLVEYGAAQDCPAGCFYSVVTAAVPQNPSKPIVEIPVWHKNALTASAIARFPGYSTVHGLECPKEDISENVSLNLAVVGGTVGWRIDLQKPYACRFFEPTFSTVGKTSIQTRGSWITRTWQGSFFARGHEEQINWIFNDLHYKDTRAPETVLDEPFSNPH